MDSRRTHSLTRWLTAAALLCATTIAAAHELEHALQQHDEPACALHLLAGHGGKGLVADNFVVPVIAYRPVTAAFVAAALPQDSLPVPRARAPPVSRL
jgi:hypothetical protein